VYDVKWRKRERERKQDDGGSHTIPRESGPYPADPRPVMPFIVTLFFS